MFNLCFWLSLACFIIKRASYGVPFQSLLFLLVLICNIFGEILISNSSLFIYKRGFFICIIFWEVLTPDGGAAHTPLPVLPLFRVGEEIPGFGYSIKIVGHNCQGSIFGTRNPRPREDHPCTKQLFSEHKTVLSLHSPPFYTIDFGQPAAW